MNYLKNSRAVLSRLVLRYKPTVCPRPPPPPSPPSQEPTAGYNCTPWREQLQSTQALLRRHYSSWSSTWSGLNRNQRSQIRTVAVTFSGGAAIALYFGRFETVPYTNRTHFIIVTPSGERWLGNYSFNRIKKDRDADILPQSHPYTVRVNGITEEILGAARRGLAGGGGDGDDMRSSDDAKRDDGRWVVEESQNHHLGKKARRAQPQTKHLDGLNWEVIVINDRSVNAMCLPGGKIMVHTALLDYLKTDAEVATVLGHEIGHVVARHTSEKLTKSLWFLVLKIVIVTVLDCTSDVSRMINATTRLLLHLANSRRMELEADHIGILLLAAAGFDPRTAPQVYAKLGKLAIGPDLELLSTHPSGKKRSQQLSQAKVMDEAMALYARARAGQRNQGFLS